LNKKTKLIDLRDEISLILDLSEKYRNKSQASDREIVRILYFKKVI